MGISAYNGGTEPYKAIFSGDIPLHRPYIGHIYIYMVGASNQSVPQMPIDDLLGLKLLELPMLSLILSES